LIEERKIQATEEPLVGTTEQKKAANKGGLFIQRKRQPLTA
jgi:hypothetical protein